MTYIRVFTATAWSLFFLYKDTLYKGKSVADISLDIKDHLGFLFEQQGRDFPNVSEMVREPIATRLQSNNCYNCPQMNEFIEKYTVLFS